MTANVDLELSCLPQHPEKIWPSTLKMIATSQDYYTQSPQVDMNDFYLFNFSIGECEFCTHYPYNCRIIGVQRVLKPRPFPEYRASLMYIVIKRIWIFFYILLLQAKSELTTLKNKNKITQPVIVTIYTEKLWVYYWVELPCFEAIIISVTCFISAEEKSSKSSQFPGLRKLAIRSLG